MGLWKKGKNKQQENNEPSLSFLQMLASLPNVLQKRFLKHFAVAVLMCVITVFLMIHFKSWNYSIGFLIALYIAYLGFEIVWSYYDDKLVCKTMVCIKANRILKDRLFVILKEMESDLPPDQTMHQFYISGNKKELDLITSGTILEVYYRPKRPLDLVAWEVTGYIGNT